MKDFENLTTEEQTNVIMQIGSKLTGQEVWYWEGIIHKLRTLQEENERLIEQLENISLDEANIRADILLEQQDYKSRNEKAMKYIEEHSYNSYFGMLQADYNMSLDAVLDILKGSEKE